MKQTPRGRDDKIISGFMFLRYMLVGFYIGIATVLGFIWWFTIYADGPNVSYWQLSHFHSCRESHNDFLLVDCNIFDNHRPDSVALSILVLIEMFNTFNALSENQSLFRVPPWANIWVVLAVALSVLLHLVILYVPFFQEIFQVAPLNKDEWSAIIFFSFPVIIIDEIMKFFSRLKDKKHRSNRCDKKTI